MEHKGVVISTDTTKRTPAPEVVEEAIRDGRLPIKAHYNREEGIYEYSITHTNYKTMQAVEEEEEIEKGAIGSHLAYHLAKLSLLHAIADAISRGDNEDIISAGHRLEELED